MDRENHCIAATPECREAARAFLPFAGEEFLVTLANKGLYKRALKDREALKETKLELRDGVLTVTLDDVIVALDVHLAQSKCSCPAKTVCKHILMAVLCAAECAGEAGTDDGMADAPAAESYAELKHADPASLKKQAGKRLYEDALRMVRQGWGAEFTEGDMLAAQIASDGVTVYFPKEHSLENAVCKCGNGLCRHKLTAVLSYLLQNSLLPEDEENAVALLEESTVALLGTALGFVTGILEKGMICCGEGDCEHAARLSLQMDAAGLGNLSRLFRSISTDLEGMLAKKAAFDARRSFSTLSRLYNTMTLLRQNPQNAALTAALVEDSRSEYYTTPHGSFVGLGAYPWQTRSGYFGVTAFLYHREKQCVCTYSASMADYYEKTAGFAGLANLTELLQRSDHWSAGLSLKKISENCLALGNFKSNRQNRLSSAKQTVCEVLQPTTLETVAALPLAGTLPSGAERRYDYFRKKGPEPLCIIWAERICGADFDKAEQALSFTVKSGEYQFPCRLPYSELNVNAVNYLEALARNGGSPRWLLCLDQGGLLFPVSAVTEAGVRNFFFV